MPDNYGYIYCITNDNYKVDDIYKLGYTAVKKPIEEVKHRLLKRYETYFINAECINIFKVYKPVKAEKQLFELLNDYNIQKEMFKADYETVIKPTMDLIEKEFKTQLVENKRDLYRPKMLKFDRKLKLAFKKYNSRDRIGELIRNEFNVIDNERVNQQNSSLIYTISSCLTNYIGKVYRNKKEEKEFMDYWYRRAYCSINFDFNDPNIGIFINNFLKIL